MSVETRDREVGPALAITAVNRQVYVEILQTSSEPIPVVTNQLRDLHVAIRETSQKQRQFVSQSM